MDRLSAAAALRGASSNRASYRGPRFGRQAMGIIPKVLPADSWGDSRIAAMLIQGGVEDLRHAVSG
jgi:hypothetical protein